MPQRTSRHGVQLYGQRRKATVPSGASAPAVKGRRCSHGDGATAPVKPRPAHRSKKAHHCAQMHRALTERQRELRRRLQADGVCRGTYTTPNQYGAEQLQGQRQCQAPAACPGATERKRGRGGPTNECVDRRPGDSRDRLPTHVAAQRDAEELV